MKPISLRLRGAIGIKEGLGLDEITLDLSGLSGLVVLDGGNGRGKTTVLDNLHPYRVLPSRSKRALHHHFFLADSCRDLTQVDSQGNTWRFLLKIDGTKGKQEGYIYKNGDGKSLVGSLKQYDAKVAELLGSEELFLSSVFAAQRQDDGNMTVGELRRQLAEYLRLHEHQERSETAKACASKLSDRIETHERRAGEIQEQMFPLCNAGDELRANEENLNVKQVARTLSTDKLTALKAQREALAARQIANEQAKARMAEIEKQIAAAESDEAETRGRQAKEVRDIDQRVEWAGSAINALTRNLIEADAVMAAADRITALRQELDVLTADRAKVAASLQVLREQADAEKAKIAANGEARAKALQEYTDKISAASTDAAQKTSAIRAAIDDLTKSLRTTAERRAVVATQIAASQRKLAALDADKEKKDLEFRIALDEEAVAGLKAEIDPACSSEVCGLIQGAKAAEKRLPQLRAELEACKGRLDAESELIQEEIDREIAESEKLGLEIFSLETTAKARQRQEAECNESAGKIVTKLREEGTASARQYDELAAEMSSLLKGLIADSKAPTTNAYNIDLNISRHQADIKQMQALADRKDQVVADRARMAAAVEKRDAVVAERLTLIARHEELRAKTSQDLATLRNKAQQISIDKRVDQDISDTDHLITAQSDELGRIDTAIAALATTIAYLQKDVEAFTRLQAEQASLREHVAVLTREVAEWKYLEIALGPNGLQALEIEFATPVICGVANELLAESFATAAMQVKMKTLTDAGKETLQLWVIRADGTETMLDDLSGGERVWVLKALRLSRLIMAKENSGFDYLAAFGDEEDGALRHGETSESFIMLYRAFRARAKFDVCYYISHKVECINMADRVISFHRSGDVGQEGRPWEESGVSIE